LGAFGDRPESINGDQQDDAKNIKIGCPAFIDARGTCASTTMAIRPMAI
jgi:hypothetical protein